MDTGNKQDTTTGNGSNTAKRKESAKDTVPMAEKSKPARQDMPKEAASISLTETLALLQTDFSDLQSNGHRVKILAQSNVVMFAIQIPASIGNASIKNGNICINGVPVSEL